MITIDDSEKSILEEVAGSGNKSLAKRAIIVLMSEADASPENIAKKSLWINVWLSFPVTF